MAVLVSKLNMLKPRRLSKSCDESITELQVAGHYRIAAGSVLVHDDVGRQICTLTAKDSFRVIQFDCPETCKKAQIISPALTTSGWIRCDMNGLELKSVPYSWQTGAQYKVLVPTDMQKDVELDSEFVATLKPGQEVLVLELGISNIKRVRLRAFVTTPDEKTVGWLCPEKDHGGASVPTLGAVDLLSPKRVALHRQSLKSRGWSFKIPSPSSSRKASDDSITQGVMREKSFDGSALKSPWVKGAKYRVLEKILVREGAELDSPVIGYVNPGTVITVELVQKQPCPGTGLTPCVYVDIEDVGCKGWLRCTCPKEGIDLIDTRDQTKFGKIMKRRNSQKEPVTLSIEEESEKVKLLHEAEEKVTTGEAVQEFTSDAGLSLGKRLVTLVANRLSCLTCKICCR